MIGTEFADQFQNGRKVTDRLRIALRLPGHAIRPQEAGHVARIGRIDEAHAGAIESGIADHGQLFFQRPFQPVRPPPLHGPE